MSSAIGPAGFGSLTHHQLAMALIHEVIARVPDCSTATIKNGSEAAAKVGGDNQNAAAQSPASVVSLSPEANASLTQDQIAFRAISRSLHQGVAQRSCPIRWCRSRGSITFSGGSGRDRQLAGVANLTI